MNEDVNLIGTKEKHEALVPEKKVQLMRFIAMLMLFSVSTAAVVLFILVALSPLPQLQKQEQSLRSALAGSHTDIGKLQLLDERVTSAGEILKARKQYDEIIAYVLQSMSGDIKITTIRMDKDALTLTVSSRSLASLDTFLNTMTTTRHGVKVFSQIMLNDLITDRESNVYMMSLRFTL